MQILSDAVADVLADDAISEAFRIFADRRTDIADPSARDRFLCTAEKAFLGRFDELRSFLRDSTDAEGIRAVPMEAMIKSADIDFDDIPFVQNLGCTRDPMNDLIVDADASTAGKASIA